MRCLVTGAMLHTYADTGRARTLLGWQPKTSLADGLAEEVAWVEAVEARGGFGDG